MSEKPILFSSETVRAILDGRKTMTRRIVKPQPIYEKDLNFAGGAKLIFKKGSLAIKPISVNGSDFCPYSIGDRVWVKEAFSFDHKDFYPNYPIVFKADGYPENWCIENGKIYSDEQKRWYSFQWKSPLFMSKRAARIWREITGIGLERVQEISEEDAKAEGVEPFPQSEGLNKPVTLDDYRGSFCFLWDSLHATPKPAKRNPYTGEKELCKVGYPWENVREETTISRKSSKFHGCKIYIVGNPWVWLLSLKEVK